MPSRSLGALKVTPSSIALRWPATITVQNLDSAPSSLSPNGKKPIKKTDHLPSFPARQKLCRLSSPSLAPPPQNCNWNVYCTSQFLLFGRWQRLPRVSVSASKGMFIIHLLGWQGPLKKSYFHSRNVASSRLPSSKIVRAGARAKLDWRIREEGKMDTTTLPCTYIRSAIIRYMHKARGHLGRRKRRRRRRIGGEGNLKNYVKE